MPKKKKEPSQTRLAAIIAENKKREQEHEPLEEDDVELTAAEMMEAYEETQRAGTGRSAEMRSRLRKHQESMDESRCCLCCTRRQCFAICLILIGIGVVVGILVATVWWETVEEILNIEDGGDDAD